MEGGADVILLRPQWWIDQRLENGDQSLRLTIPELAINGPAQVLAIKPCPPIKSGEGQVVIGTFIHRNKQTVNLYIEGNDEPIRCTLNHPFWSEDRQTYVEVEDLRPNERLRSRGGFPRVIRIEPIEEPTYVFNLEVHSDVLR